MQMPATQGNREHRRRSQRRAAVGATGGVGSFAVQLAKAYDEVAP
jgi:NADPH:quinone reductase-like Zn-dependent oxidoreductase